MNLNKRSVSQLLFLYSDILEELRSRCIIRSSNNPVADYSEYLCVNAFTLQSADKSTKGFDATDSQGIRYQIKGRRLTRHNSSRQLGMFRDLEKDPFDYLIGILFDENFRVHRACKLPISIVRTNSQRVERTNSCRFVLRDSIWLLHGAVDVTKAIVLAQSTHGF